jgi:hypothetical protein
MKLLRVIQIVLAAATVGPLSTSLAEPVPESVIQLKAQHSGKCVHQQGASPADGGAVTQWTCTDQPNVRLEKLPAGSGYFFLRFQHSGKCLTVANEARSNGTPIIQQTCDYAGPVGQTWKELPGDGRYVKIQSTTGLCLHQHGNITGDGDPISGWECVDQPNVRWEIIAQGNIQPAAADKQSTATGLPLQTQPMSHVATNKPFLVKRQIASGSIQEVTIAESPDTDSLKGNTQLQARYASVVLDESDRAELKLDAEQFAQLTAGVAAKPETLQSAPLQQVMGAPGGGADSASVLQGPSIRSAYAAQRICELHYQNQPRISRVLPASDGYLVPAELFIIKGACFGDQPGTVEIRFGGSPATVYRPLVVGWESSKILAQVPKDVSGVPPTNVHVVVTTAQRRQAPPHTMAFWPRWERVSVGEYARNSGCYSDPSYPHVRSHCKGWRDTVPKQTEPFDMPDDCRGALCFLRIWTTFGTYHTILAKHYTEEDIAIQPTVGVDRWTFDLPPYARIAGWRFVEYETFDPAKTGIRLEADQSTRELLVHWHMSEMGEQGYLGYHVDGVYAWLPVGVLKR